MKGAGTTVRCERLIIVTVLGEDNRFFYHLPRHSGLGFRAGIVTIRANCIENRVRGGRGSKRPPKIARDERGTGEGVNLV